MNGKVTIGHASILLSVRSCNNCLSLLYLEHLVLSVIIVSSVGQFCLLLFFSLHVAIYVDEAASRSRDGLLVLVDIAHLFFNLLSVNVRRNSQTL